MHEATATVAPGQRQLAHVGGQLRSQHICVCVCVRACMRACACVRVHVCACACVVGFRDDIYRYIATWLHVFKVRQLVSSSTQHIWLATQKCTILQHVSCGFFQNMDTYGVKSWITLYKGGYCLGYMTYLRLVASYRMCLPGYNEMMSEIYILQ